MKTQPPRLIARARAAVRQRDGNRCTKCGITNDEHVAESGRSLHVHRLTPGSLYSLKGCILLCRQCHGSEPRRQLNEPDLAKGPSFMIRLPEKYRAVMQNLTSKNRRTMTTELQIALDKHAKTQGIPVH